MSKKRNVWKWGIKEDEYINSLVFKGSTIVLGEVTNKLSFSISTIRKRISARAKELNLKVVGIWTNDLITVTECEGKKPKKLVLPKPTPLVENKYMCKCSTENGIMLIKVSALNESLAKSKAESNYLVKVLEVLPMNKFQDSKPKGLPKGRQYI